MINQEHLQRSQYTHHQQTSTHSTIYSNYSNSRNENNELLKQYRKNKQIEKKEEEQQTIQKEQQSFFQKIICKLLIGESENLKAEEMGSKCQCPKNQEGLCTMIMEWIDRTYYWKTDPNFKRTYKMYSIKGNDDLALDEMIRRIEQKLKTVGFKLKKEEIQCVAQILLNYEKHVEYYEKNNAFLKDSDIYIWIGLGISFHIGFGPKLQHANVIFWALNIVMEKFQSFSLTSLNQRHKQAMKRFNYYFYQWNDLLLKKGISLSQIVREWLNELLFGYMGLQSIGFFLDCFLKVGQNYIYKVLLSFFEYRIIDLKKNPSFLKGDINRETMLAILLDGKYEWPMIFCSAATYPYTG